MRRVLPHVSVLFYVIAIAPQGALAQALTTDIEAVRVDAVGASWVTVPTINTYSNPVVACTYTLPARTDPPAVVRMQNAGPTSFQIRLQQFENSSIVTAGTVHCLIVDEGSYVLPGGQPIEAHRVVSTNTSGKVLGWGAALQENVTATLSHTYSSLVVTGQVMTFNDARASVFWTNNCSNRAIEPQTGSFCVGKHIGSLSGSRSNETLGYIVTQPGTGTVNDVQYAFAKGPDSIAGTNAAPHTYAVTGNFDTAVLQMAGEDGGDGGWAVLFGADPLPNNQIVLAIEEETAAGDTSRSHTNEEVFYMAFRDNQSANVTAAKSAATYDGGFALPGNDVVYTLTVANSGSAPSADGTIFLVDSLPSTVSFYNGDVDDAGPESGPVAFSAGTSGLTFNDSADLRFSNTTARPASFAACSYTPVTGYDSNVRHVCFNPKGRLNSGTLHPGSGFSLKFRARVN